MPIIFSQQRTVSLLRIVTGLMVLSAGLNKVLIIGTQNFASYIQNLPQLGFMQNAVAYGLPWIEIILGIALIIGIFTRISSMITALIFGGMIVYMGFFSQAGSLMMNHHSYICLNAIAFLFLGKEPTQWSFDTWLKKYQKSKNVKTIKV